MYYIKKQDVNIVNQHQNILKKIIILILGILTLSSCKIGLNEKEQEFCNVIEDPVFESIFVYKGILKLNVEYKNEHGKFINDSIEACENRNFKLC